MKYIMINYKPILEKKNLDCHYIDADAFVLRIISKDIIRDLKKSGRHI